MNSSRMSALGVCIAFMTMTQAIGQTAPKTGALTVPSRPEALVPTPDRTTASFGDWVLRCDRRTDVTPPQRFCELGQTIQRQGNAGPQAQIALGRILPTDPILLTVLLPINVELAKGPRLTGDRASLDLAWVRCLPSGCFASGVVSDDLLGKLRAQKEAGRLTYRDGTGRDVVLPLSFRGFSEALNAFAGEASK